MGGRSERPAASEVRFSACRRIVLGLKRTRSNSVFTRNGKEPSYSMEFVTVEALATLGGIQTLSYFKEIWEGRGGLNRGILASLREDEEGVLLTNGSGDYPENLVLRKKLSNEGVERKMVCNL